MKERTYKKLTPYGHIKLMEGTSYKLLAPHPIVKDSWMTDEQQMWAVAVPQPEKYLRVDGIPQLSHFAMNLIVGVQAAAIFLNPYERTIFVWDGGYAEAEMELVSAHEDNPGYNNGYEEEQ